MIFSDFTLAAKSGQLGDVNIITHSGLGRYAVKVRLRGSEHEELLGKRPDQPHFWSSLSAAKKHVRHLGYAANVGLEVSVAQDEIIGRI